MIWGKLGTRSIHYTNAIKSSFIHKNRLASYKHHNTETTDKKTSIVIKTYK